MHIKIVIFGFFLIFSGIFLSLWIDSEDYPGHHRLNPKSTIDIHLIIQPGARINIDVEAELEIYLAICDLTGYSKFEEVRDILGSVSNQEVVSYLTSASDSRLSYGNSLSLDFKLKAASYVIVIFNPHESYNDFSILAKVNWRPYSLVGQFLSVCGILITLVVLLNSKSSEPAMMHIKQPFSRIYAKK